jgi:hypothetical protein
VLDFKGNSGARSQLLANGIKHTAAHLHSLESSTHQAKKQAKTAT